MTDQQLTTVLNSKKGREILGGMGIMLMGLIALICLALCFNDEPTPAAPIPVQSPPPVIEVVPPDRPKAQDSTIIYLR